MSTNPLCIADVIRKRGAETPDRTAMIFEDNPTSWATLDSRSSQLANALAAAGVSNQDRIGFITRTVRLISGDLRGRKNQCGAGRRQLAVGRT
jgi:acyl-CoA synthetase (AMP-forming)/AMP-acid ligase II